RWPARQALQLLQSLGHELLDDLEEVERQQLLRPAYQQGRGMAGLRALELPASLFQQLLQIFAARYLNI
ncbi:hypothetical protein LMH44_11215, partial [Neisseria gonorrhoeae]|uniref:hypothetical protein n=1 Tax=Neisseria gonorrhoeae TaxID=485 RepID=UPI001E5A91BB